MGNKLENINKYLFADCIRQIQNNRQESSLQNILKNILSIALTSADSHYEVDKMSVDTKIKLRELGFKVDLYDESYHNFRWSICW